MLLYDLSVVKVLEEGFNIFLNGSKGKTSKKSKKEKYKRKNEAEAIAKHCILIQDADSQLKHNNNFIKSWFN